MSIFLVIPKLDYALASWGIRKKFQQIGQSPNFTIWTRTSPDLTTQEKLNLDSKKVNRIFESCYVVQTTEDEHRNELVRLLFDELSGDKYRSTITTSLNIDCYEALLLGAQEFCARPIEKILDFGCGPGTIVSSTAYKKFEDLVGFDFIEKNRETAEQVGLITLNEKELETTPPGRFDLIVCCYVLHYESLSTATIQTLIERLSAGGIWAANFHKSKGLLWFRNSLPPNSNLEIISENSKFGELMFIKKVSNSEK